MIELVPIGIPLLQPFIMQSPNRRNQSLQITYKNRLSQKGGQKQNNELVPVHFIPHNSRFQRFLFQNIQRLE